MATQRRKRVQVTPAMRIGATASSRAPWREARPDRRCRQTAGCHRPPPPSARGDARPAPQKARHSVRDSTTAATVATPRCRCRLQSAKASSGCPAFRVAMSWRWNRHSPALFHRPHRPSNTGAQRRRLVRHRPAAMPSMARRSSVLRRHRQCHRLKRPAVARITPSAMAGEACWLRPRHRRAAPVSAPHCFSWRSACWSCLRDAPAISMLPCSSTLTSTISPIGLSMPVVSMSLEATLARCKVLAGGGHHGARPDDAPGAWESRNTSSRSSPSRPMEVTPTATPCPAACKPAGGSGPPSCRCSWSYPSPRRCAGRTRAGRCHRALGGSWPPSVQLTSCWPMRLQTYKCSNSWRSGLSRSSSVRVRRGPLRSRCPRSSPHPCPRPRHPAPQR
jgi:hypothetical protein